MTSEASSGTSTTLARIGTATIATGVGHNLIGAWLYRRQLAGIARDGVLDAIENQRVESPERERRQTALWFLMSGGAFATLGAALRRTDDGDTAVAPIGTGMVAMGVVGAAVLPRSGFWLLIAEGVAAMAVGRRSAR
jgi:hypothetical protein